MFNKAGAYQPTIFYGVLHFAAARCGRTSCLAVCACCASAFSVSGLLADIGCAGRLSIGCDFDGSARPECCTFF
jgi:hypothetical protein